MSKTLQAFHSGNLAFSSENASGLNFRSAWEAQVLWKQTCRYPGNRLLPIEGLFTQLLKAEQHSWAQEAGQ